MVITELKQSHDPQNVKHFSKMLSIIYFDLGGALTALIEPHRSSPHTCLFCALAGIATRSGVRREGFKEEKERPIFSQKSWPKLCYICMALN